MKKLLTGHAVFKLYYHLVIVTKYRNKILDERMIEDIRDIVENIMTKRQCRLVELNGERDHVHILFESLPTLNLTTLVNSVKTVTSRMIRKKYGLVSLKKSKPTLWSPSYFIATCGDVKLDILKRYIDNQGSVD